MKKTVKTVKKTKKNTRKSAKKGYSDPFKALMLVVVLVALAAGISLAVIFVHSNKSDDFVEAQAEEQPVKAPVQEKPVPAVSVAIKEQPPAPTPAPAPAAVAVTPTPAAPPAPVQPASSTASTSNTVSSAAAQKPVENMGTLVFVIDDAGNNLRELEPFLNIPGPLTIAVLPGLPYSAEAAKRIRAAGKEVILHQPMEALGGQNPGPGAIYSGMTAAEIREILARNIAEVGPVAGMNNHQGSKVTMDREMMETILSFCAENKIYFLDSRTTAETAAPAAARRLGMSIAERDIFIDNEPDRESMTRFITSGLSRAQRNGKAVMIGHVQSAELAPLLAQQFPVWTIQGYTIKTVSELLR